MSLPLILLLGLALVFNFLNGINSSSNIAATIIFSRAMPPRLALWLTAVAEFCGPLLFGVAVARTIGEDIVIPGTINVYVIIAALVSANLWSLITWFFGIPSSSSHALIGGIVGAVGVSVGFGVIQLDGMIKVVLALLISPILGFLMGFLITRLVFFLARNASLKINWWFKRGQILTGIGLALSYGANDAQKAMGIIALGLLTAGAISQFEVPFWVILTSAAATSLGTAFGGWRLIQTVGGKFYRIHPVDGFCSQIGSASVILGAALIGGPVSTTQVVSSSIMGVGTAERATKVRWGVAQNIALTWLITIPANMALAAGVYLASRLFFSM